MPLKLEESSGHCPAPPRVWPRSRQQESNKQARLFALPHTWTFPVLSSHSTQLCLIFLRLSSFSPFNRSVPFFQHFSSLPATMQLITKHWAIMYILSTIFFVSLEVSNIILILLEYCILIVLGDVKQANCCWKMNFKMLQLQAWELVQDILVP